MQNATTILNNIFGYQDFRPHQQEIIENLIEGQDALVLMPTGGGKSLCYQIPAICRQGTGIVISPLIALMQDQVEALNQYGIKAAYINSTQTPEQQQAIEEQLKSNEIELLYITPERLLMGRTINLLSQCQLSLFAIDEAHCVSQWGHDFRPEYQQLKRLHQTFPEIPRVALTATADQRTRDEIIDQLDLHEARRFITSFDRPNIHYRISETGSKEDLWKFMQNSHANNAGIVYCLSRKKVEDIAQWLSDKGREALPYHAGLTQKQREENQQRFLRENNLIMVATIAFGMGIDKPDVRFVAHLNLPKSIEAYYQETGRAGRDGLPADAWMTYSLKDLVTLKQMNQENQHTEQHFVTHSKLEKMLALCESTSCRRHYILNYFDETSDPKCGNCDICIDPPETWDATEAARKALSCVYRTGQRFGVSYVTDVLLGKSNNRISQNRHESLSTFGIGNEHTNSEWKNIFRQLIGHGYLDVKADQFGAVALTEKARPLLKGDTTLNLRKLRKSSTKTASSQRSVLRDIDEELFEALRQLRLELSRKENVPPYVIFHDKTLVDMSRKRPQNLQEMTTISGMGQKKIDKFGADFLQLIQQFDIHPWLKNSLSETVNDTLSCYLDKRNVKAVAETRQLTESTIYSHLSKAIEDNVIALKEITEIKNAETELVKNAIRLCEAEGDDSARCVFESLNGEIDYGIINCVRASMASSPL